MSNKEPKIRIVKKVTRNSTIDNLKGLMIIMVVLGHTYNPLFNDFVFLFHVGVFFILSGYCFNQEYINDFNGLKELLVKRIKSLWIPYVAYNLIFLVMQNFLIRVGFLTTNLAYFDYNPISPDGFCQPLTLQTGIITFVKSLFFINSRPFAGGLWFLGGLFYVTISYTIIQFILKKLNIEKFHIICSLLMLLLGWLFIEMGVVVKVPLAKQFCIILVTEILFTIGTYIRCYIVLPKLCILHYIVGFMYFAILTYFLSRYDSISIANVHIVNPLFYITSILTGGGISFCFVKIVPIFSYIGKKTIPILALHLISFKIISIIQWIYYGSDDVTLSLFPIWTRSPTVFWSLLCCVVGVGVPLFISILFSKSKVCKFLFKC